MPEKPSRIVCQFSCDAASAVATKLALAEYGSTHDVQIINAFTPRGRNLPQLPPHSFHMGRYP